MEEKLWNPDEIAQKLRVDPATVRRWLRDGEIKGIKIGRQWRIENSELEAFIARLKAKSEQENQ